MANTAVNVLANESIQISAFPAPPATNDQAGFENALMVWVEANNCAVTSMPSLGGTTWAIAFADKAFCGGGAIQFKDKSNRQAQDMSMEIYLDATDADAVAFKAILDASEANPDGTISLRQKSADGIYFLYVTVKVYEQTPDVASPEGKALITYGMIPRSEVVKVVI